MRPTLAQRGVMLDAIISSYAGALVRGYNGTDPTSSETAIGAQTLLWECTMGSPAFGSSTTSGTNRILTANAITSDSSANATGDTDFVRVFASDGTTVLNDFLSVGTSGTEVIMPSITVTAGEPVDIASLTITFPQGS